ncbi:hypothetical protein PM082_003301 [Marasmius tenuissimus]|nr:hypothetical protein PM082_003301 [Marasmius tenuissimus]
MTSSPRAISSRRSSLITFLTRKSFSFDTESEQSSVVDGPGAISGRWIEALGRLTLGRYERLVIQRKLLDIKNYFPHTDEDQLSKNTYDDLLELSRPDFDVYSKGIRRQVLGLIMVQIATRQTSQLLGSLARWDPKELETRLVLLEYLKCLPITGNSDEPKHGALYAAPARRYSQAVSKHEPSLASPFLDFLLQLGQINRDHMKLVLDIVRPYLSSTVPTHHPLAILCQQIISETPLKPVSLVTMRYSPDLRRKTWSSLELHVCGRRLEQMFMKQERYSEGVELFDACVDSVDFTFKDALSTSAWSFVKRMIFPTNSRMIRRRRILAEALALFPFVDQVSFCTTLIQQLKYRPESFPKERSFQFIEFTLEAARLDASIRTALVHSRCVAYYNDTLGHDVNDRHAPPGVESEKQELWELIREVFGEELQQSLDEDTSLLNKSSTSFNVQLLNNFSEEYLIQVVISAPGRSQRWTIYKRLPDLLAVSRHNRQGQDALTFPIDETSESTRPSESNSWREYHSLTSDKKENFVEHFLRELARQSGGPYSQDITTFFTSNIVGDGEADKFPVHREVSASPTPGRSSEEAALESAARHDVRSFLYMKDEDARFDRFLDVGNRLGLL